MQLAAIQALAASEDERVAAALLDSWKVLTPQLRDEVLKAIFARENRQEALLDAIEKMVVPVTDVTALRREQLTKSDNDKIAVRARTLFENPAADAELARRLDEYHEASVGALSSARR